MSTLSDAHVDGSDSGCAAGGARPVTVFHVSPGGLGAKGGIGRCLSYLVQSWQSQTDMPDWRVFDPYGPGKSRAGKALISPVYFCIALITLAAAALARRPDLVHVHLAHKGSTVRKYIIVCLLRALRTNYVIHLHSGRYDAFFESLSTQGRDRVRWMFRGAERVIVLGEYWRSFVRDGIGVGDDRIAVLPSAVPEPALGTSDRARNGPCRILFLGLISHEKGIPELLNAFASQNLAALSWTATLAGKGEVRRYSEMAKTLGVADRIHFPGWVEGDAVAALLADADILVLPSHIEGLSMAVLEGLANRLAVIATPVGATAEAIVDGETGLMVPPGDVDRLAGALARLINDPDLRHRLAANGRKLYESRFSLESYSQRMTALYKDCIRAKS